MCVRVCVLEVAWGGSGCTGVWAVTPAPPHPAPAPAPVCAAQHNNTMYCGLYWVCTQPLCDPLKAETVAHIDLGAAGLDTTAPGLHLILRPATTTTIRGGGDGAVARAGVVQVCRCLVSVCWYIFEGTFPGGVAGAQDAPPCPSNKVGRITLEFSFLVWR